MTIGSFIYYRMREEHMLRILRVDSLGFESFFFKNICENFYMAYIAITKQCMGTSADFKLKVFIYTNSANL